jgi:hypothetical protein
MNIKKGSAEWYDAITAFETWAKSDAAPYLSGDINDKTPRPHKNALYNNGQIEGLWAAFLAGYTEGKAVYGRD